MFNFKALKKLGCVSRGHLTGASLNVDSVSETVSMCYTIGSIRLYVFMPVPATVNHFQLVKITGLEKNQNKDLYFPHFELHFVCTFALLCETVCRCMLLRLVLLYVHRDCLGSPGWPP